MNRVVVNGNIVVVLIYILVAVFGYLTIVGTEQEAVVENSTNYLEVDYNGNIFFTLAIIAMLLSVFSATTICVLPSKDSFEELMFKTVMTPK
jgi:uncharacterized membrane protein YukC